MGLGALLIPGGNDTLLMIGFAMGAWQAALAYVLFVATLAALIAKFVDPPRHRVRPSEMGRRAFSRLGGAIGQRG